MHVGQCRYRQVFDIDIERWPSMFSYFTFLTAGIFLRSPSPKPS